jgi:hypothetical protein
MATIHAADQFEDVPMLIGDLPDAMLIESLREDWLSLHTKQCLAGIRALEVYLGLIENDQLGVGRLLSTEMLQTCSELTLEGRKALTKFHEWLTDELASSEREVRF